MVGSNLNFFVTKFFSKKLKNFQQNKFSLTKIKLDMNNNFQRKIFH